jgi:L-threonylcarbamoyladenylate synthase
VERHAIEARLGRKLRLPEQDARIAAPGMLPSHYAPTATLRCNATAVLPGEALLAFGPSRPGGAARAVATVNLSPTADLAEAAANLFGALRELDRKAAAIAVMPIPEQGLGEAINDRLRRASAPRD